MSVGIVWEVVIALRRLVFSVGERERMVEERVPSYWECFSNFCQQTILHGWHYLTVSQGQSTTYSDSSCCCPTCPASHCKPSLLDFSLTNLSEQETSGPPGTSSSQQLQQLQQQQQQLCSITRTHCQAELNILYPSVRSLILLKFHLSLWIYHSNSYHSAFSYFSF